MNPTIEILPVQGPNVSILTSGPDAVAVDVVNPQQIKIDVIYSQGGSGSIKSKAGWVCTNTTGAPIGGGRVVTVDRSSGSVVYVDPTNLDHSSGPFGVTVNSIADGATDYALTAGDISGMAFALPIGTLLFCGSNGTLVPYSSIPGGAKFALPIGSIASSSELAVNVSPTPIIRE